MHEDVLEFLKTQFPGPWEAHKNVLSFIEAEFRLSLLDLDIRIEMDRGKGGNRRKDCLFWILVDFRKVRYAPGLIRPGVQLVHPTKAGIEAQVQKAVGRAFAEALKVRDYKHPLSAYPSWVAKAYESWRATGG